MGARRNFCRRGGGGKASPKRPPPRPIMRKKNLHVNKKIPIARKNTSTCRKKNSQKEKRDPHMEFF